MLHQALAVLGLGILGVDPIAALYLATMGLRRESKAKIRLFFYTFMAVTAAVGIVLSTLLGAAAVDFLKGVLPGWDSPFWAWVRFAVALLILGWVLKRALGKRGGRKKQRGLVQGGALKQMFLGSVFTATSLTDPTFYAVILMGAETGSALVATSYLIAWLLISQFMTVTVYIAAELDTLNRFMGFMEGLRSRHERLISRVFNGLLVFVAAALLLDAAAFLFTGSYLF